MSEQRPPQTQDQQPSRSPDSCSEPGQPGQRPGELPCPPPEKPCPEKKPCPEPPKRPKPTSDTSCNADKTEASPSEATDVTLADNPKAHLEDLRKKLKADQDQLEKLNPLTAEVSDLTARIEALEKALDGRSTAASDWTDFYRGIELFRSEIECFIPTVRCQIMLTPEQKKCICDAIAVVNARVDAARKESAAKNAEVADLEKKAKRAADDLVWWQQWYDFLKTGLKDQVTKQRDDLKALKQLADPTKDKCEVWFYLYEMERLLMSSYGATDACWKADLTIGTFLDCWRWDCYDEAWKKVIVAYNDADATDKAIKNALESAKKRAGELDAAAKDAEKNRRDWILKEIRDKRCCPPTHPCP